MHCRRLRSPPSVVHAPSAVHPVHRPSRPRPPSTPQTLFKGMLHSRGELLLMLDADGATKVTNLEKLDTQIRDFAKMVKDLSSVTATAVDSSQKVSDTEVAAFGSRAHLEKHALATRKWYRNFLMKGFHLVVLLTAGPGIRDTQYGFKMFTRAAARKLFTNIRLKRFAVYDNKVYHAYFVV